MADWKLINSDMIEPYVCDSTYSSKMLTGDELVGFPIININEGTLAAGCRTGGGTHEDTEIYYIVDGTGILWLDEDGVNVKSGDVIVIPPHCFHWIDNTMNDKPFKLFTFWPKQEQNGVYFARKEAWGKSFKFKDQ